MQYIQSPDDFKFSVVQWISYSPKTLSANPDDYPKWISDYADPYKYICDLISENLVETCDLKEKLCKLKSQDLKSILLNNGIQVSGKKEQLIDRIVNSVDPNLIRIPDAVKIAESGKVFLEVESEKKFASNLLCYGISAREYYEAKRISKKPNKEDVLFEVLSQKQHEASSFSVLYSIHSTMREMCITKNDKQNAMQHTIYLAYYQLCIQNDIELNFTDLPSRLSNQLYELKEYYNKSMVENCKTIPLPYSHFPPNINTFKSVIEKYIS